MTETGGATLRVDKLLWFTRLAPTRSAAAKLAEDGHIRISGRRIERAHCPVRVGDVLSVPRPAGVRVVRVLQLPRARVGAGLVSQLIEEVGVDRRDEGRVAGPSEGAP